MSSAQVIPPSQANNDPPRSDTPRTLRLGNTQGNFHHSRRGVASEMQNEMLACPLATFRAHYLPFSPTEEAVDEGIRKLREKGLLVKPVKQTPAESDNSSNSHASADSQDDANSQDDASASSQNDADSSQNDASDSSNDDLVWHNDVLPTGAPTETIGFQPLCQISDCLENVGIEGRQATYCMKQRPHHPAESSIWGGSQQMDGCCYEKVKLDGNPLSMGNIGRIDEYKMNKTPEATEQNRLQVVSGAAFAMNESPRRMFIFGLTIEDDIASLWHFSRSHSTKSENFNWHEDIRTMVAVFLSFIFATQSELGFDPTVTRFNPTDGGPEYFVYEVQDSDSQAKKYFKTKRSISEYPSLCISGRSTRVWLVEEVISDQDHTPVDGKEKVLKDVWLDEDAQTERQIQDDIFRDVDSFIEKVDAGMDVPELSTFEETIQQELRALLGDGNYKQHFLTIYWDGNGVTSKSTGAHSRVDHTIFSSHVSSTVSPQTPTADPSRSQMHTMRNPPPTKESVPLPRKFAPKRQYRVVYEEVCQAMQELKSFPDSMKALRGGVIGLILMYFAVWIHRDISGGNILWFTDGNGNKRGILGDLEYSKKPSKNSPPSADPKTGTPFFMAYEIMRRVMLYRPPAPSVYPGYMRASTTIPATHNFLHDAESIWWLHLWTMTARVQHPSSQTLAHKVFVNQSVPSSSREQLFLGHCTFDHELHPKLVELSTTLNTARSGLLWAFETAPDARTPTVYSTVYTQLLHLCRESTFVDIQDLKPYPERRLIPSPRSGPLAPGRVDDDAEYSPSDDLDDRPLKKRRH